MSRQCAIILLVCAAVFANTLSNSFHYDDEHSIQYNINVRDVANIPSFFTTPGMFSVDADKGMYRPLLLVTYALNYAWGEYEVYGYHVVNIALHAVNACLLSWLCMLLHGRSGASFICGLLFAIYPLATEPVNYISSRSESFSGMFYLAGICFLVRAGPASRLRYMLASWAALALGLLSKSTVITLPAVLLAYELAFVSGFDLKRFFRHRFYPWHLIFWATGVGYLLLIRLNGFLVSSLDNHVRNGDTQLFTQTKAIAYYAKLLLWPWGLNVEHQFFEHHAGFELAVILPGIFLVSLLFLLYRFAAAGWKLPFFLGFWGVVSLLPASVIPLNVLVNERRLYLACGAFCIVLGVLFNRAIESRHRFRQGRMAAVAVLLLILTSLTYLRNQDWRTDFTLWTDAVSKAPQMPRVHLYMGNAHTHDARTSFDPVATKRHWSAAAASYRRAIKVKPDDVLAIRSLNNLGSVNFELGNYAEAEEAYRKALELNPVYADALVNLGNTYQQRALGLPDGDIRRKELLTTAIEQYGEALKILPNHSAAYGNMGFALFNVGAFEHADAAYRKAVGLNPRAYNALNNLGNLYITLGQQAMRSGEDGQEFFKQAESFFMQSWKINPAYEKSKRGVELARRLLRSAR